MGTIIPFTSNFEPGDIEEYVRDTVAASITSRILTTRKLTATTGNMEFTDNLSGGEQTTVTNAIAAVIQPVLGIPVSFAKYRRTNNTGTETVTYTPPTSSTARFEVIVTASNGTAVKVFKVFTQVKRGAGNAIQVGAPIALITPQGDAALNNATVTASVSGTNAVLTLSPGAGFSGVCHWLVEISGRVFNP